ncbi:hypothetical protein [Psychrobacillus antarcticus]|uniref:hypothetical protein n=1 Tax=Psychrobacillus antarcticus TaxID=2879115 RepID=UPI002407FBF7|nr:hypothetical protein [Psychrobacillus antarcticus]
MVNFVIINHDFGLSFLIAIDRNRSVMKSYNNDILPMTILINLDGMIEKVIKGEMSVEDNASLRDQIKPS